MWQFLTDVAAQVVAGVVVALIVRRLMFQSTVAPSAD